jgi:ectoine hydroxylase-related dioxygenase (phytanoyl-CoA dioxygenase family)
VIGVATEVTVMNRIDPAQIQDFQEDGAVALRGLFREWVEPLRAAIERNMAEPSAGARIYPAKDGSGLFFGDYCNWSRFAEYADFLRHSALAETCAALMGARTVRLFHEHVLVKEPGTDMPTPWHHDQPYYSVDGQQNCSVWVALDTVPRDTAVEFIAGSHRWGRWFRPEKFDRTALYEDDGLEAVPDIDAERGRYRVLGWDLEPGDAVAFHFLTLHGAPGNRATGRRRRAFSARVVGDDARWAVRKGRTSPPFAGVTLAPGDPLQGPEFPVLYPRPA